jgi:hypothetical protein
MACRISFALSPHISLRLEAQHCTPANPANYRTDIRLVAGTSISGYYNHLGLQRSLSPMEPELFVGREYDSAGEGIGERYSSKV